MAVKCNMTEEEQWEAMALFRAPSADELDRARGGFKRYLFYDTWGLRNFREYYCPFCGRFEIERPYHDAYIEDPFSFHHNDLANCPMCHEELTLICLGRMRNMRSLEQWGRLLFVRANGDRLTISAGTAVRRFDPEDLDPWPEYHETMRFVISPGRRQGWKKQTIWEGCWPVGHQWLETKTVFETFQSNYFASTEGTGYVVGAENIEKTDMKYCQLLPFAWKVWNVDLLEQDGYPASPVRGLVSYLAEYSRRPQIEMLVKLGFEDVVQRLLERGSLPKTVVDWKAKTPAAFFRMTKEEFRDFCELKGQYADIELFREGSHDPAGDMSLTEYVAARNYLDRETRNFFNLCGNRGISARQALRYIHEQAPEGANGAATFIRWKDYIDMAVELGRNMTFRRNLFPEDLWEAHDAATALVKRTRQSKENKKYGTRFRWLKKKYAYTDGRLLVKVPVNAKDIELEGKTLQHCVGGYANRHILGQTTILFLRKAEAPEERYITIEIDDALCRIRQVHGFRNEGYAGAVKPMVLHKEFFDEWLLWLRQGSPRTRNGRPIRPKQKEEKTA